MMRKSIKRTVAIRVVAALVSILLFSCLTTYNIFRIQGLEATNTQANSLLDRANKAETAHYKWSSNLSNALYAGAEFTGSIDPTTCVLGQWLYGDAGTEDAAVLALRSQIEPIHKEIHESATYVLDLLSTNPTQARDYSRAISSRWWGSWTRSLSGPRLSAMRARPRWSRPSTSCISPARCAWPCPLCA